MLQKPKPKSQWFKNFKQFAKIAVAVEVGLFCGSYYIWRRLNSDQGSQRFLFFFKEN